MLKLGGKLQRMNQKTHTNLKWGGMDDGKDDTGQDDNGGEGRVLLKRRRGITANQNGMKG